MSIDQGPSFDPMRTIADNAIQVNTPNIKTGYLNSIAGNSGNIPSFDLVNIDDLLSIAGLGPLDSAVTANFWGIRRTGHALAQPLPSENTGMTFFTKPRMNLSDSNIYGNLLSLLANKNTKSLATAIRAFLDPYTGGTGQHTATASKGMNNKVYKSELVDPLNPFITILGNNCVSISGFPDVDMNTYQAPEGLFHESWAMADDTIALYGRYDLNCTFRNLYGDPIGMMIFLWIYYMSEVYQGNIVPYVDSILDNEIDYQTRIYRFTLDPTRTRVLKMFCCGAAFPTAANLGANFNFNADKHRVDDSDEYSVSFNCSGAVYYDPRIIKWFNKTVTNFNPGMLDENRESTYVKIPYQHMSRMDNMGYPRINPFNMDLEWWIEPKVYEELIQRGY